MKTTTEKDHHRSLIYYPYARFIPWSYNNIKKQKTLGYDSNMRAYSRENKNKFKNYFIILKVYYWLLNILGVSALNIWIMQELYFIIWLYFIHTTNPPYKQEQNKLFYGSYATTTIF